LHFASGKVLICGFVYTCVIHLSTKDQKRHENTVIYLLESCLLCQLNSLISPYYSGLLAALAALECSCSLMALAKITPPSFPGRGSDRMSLARRFNTWTMSPSIASRGSDG
jgi:hypothetical protein